MSYWPQYCLDLEHAKFLWGLLGNFDINSLDLAQGWEFVDQLIEWAGLPAARNTFAKPVCTGQEQEPHS